MTLLGACVLAALALALVMAFLAMLALEAIIGEVRVYETHDNQRAILEEREALRLLRARFARGEVGDADFARLTYELEHGHRA